MAFRLTEGDRGEVGRWRKEVIRDPSQIVVGGRYQQFHFSKDFPTITVLTYPNPDLGLSAEVTVARLGIWLPERTTLRKLGVGGDGLDNFLVRDRSVESNTYDDWQMEKALPEHPKRLPVPYLCWAAETHNPDERISCLTASASYMRLAGLKLAADFKLVPEDIAYIVARSIKGVPEGEIRLDHPLTKRILDIFPQ